MNYQLSDRRVRILGTAHYIAPSATLIANVTIHSRVTIWFGAVLRGDNAAITVREDSNIQDGCVLHTDPGYPLLVGAGVTVGHGAVLHSCNVGDGTLIGIHATILSDAVIGHDCIIGANSLVTEETHIPDGCLAFGVPARPHRPLTDAERQFIRNSADEYWQRGVRYAQSLRVMD